MKLPPDAFGREMERIVAATADYGGLRGKEGFFASKDQKEIRAMANRTYGNLAPRLVEMYDRLNEVRDRLRTAEEAREVRMAIAVPDLSPEARAAMHKACDEQRPEKERVEAQREALANPAIAQELNAFMTAVQERFYANYEAHKGYQPNLPDGAQLSPEVSTDLMYGRRLYMDIQREQEMSYEQREELVLQRQLANVLTL